MALVRLVADFPPRRPGFDPRSDHVRFVVDEVALGQVFSEYFGFPCQSSFHRLLHNHHLSSGAGTIGQQVADVPSGLSLTPPRETKKKTWALLRDLPAVTEDNHKNTQSKMWRMFGYIPERNNLYSHRPEGLMEH
jgi:hypothetical protein